jgi:rubrerythrin
MFARVDFSKLTLMDALDLACLIELEALKRYMLFSAQLGHRDTNDAAAVFRTMAENEKKHGEQLARRREILYGDTPPRVKLDDLFDVEAPDVSAARWNMSPRKAFEVALAAEQKAYAFYDQALPGVKEPQVKALFEELRNEEVEHVRMVEDIIAKLPPTASLEREDEDAL